MWKEEQDEILREMWSRGMPTRLIADTFGCTRSAVIGRAHRLGLNEHKRARNKGTGKCRSQQLKKPPIRETPNRPLRLPPAVLAAVVPKSVQAFPSDPDFACTLEQLDGTNCRYPYGEGNEMRYCGRPCFNNSSYCEQHWHLTHARYWVKSFFPSRLLRQFI